MIIVIYGMYRGIFLGTILFVHWTYKTNCIHFEKVSFRLFRKYWFSIRVCWWCIEFCKFPNKHFFLGSQITISKMYKNNLNLLTAFYGSTVRELRTFAFYKNFVKSFFFFTTNWFHDFFLSKRVRAQSRVQKYYKTLKNSREINSFM